MRMTGARLLKLGTLASAATALPAATWAHPGHEHSTGWLAQLLHSVTNWGPLLVVLAIAAAGSYWLWKSRGS
jgi:hypothetical protein